MPPPVRLPRLRDLGAWFRLTPKEAFWVGVVVLLFLIGLTLRACRDGAA